MLSVTLFLVAINGILGELGNGVDGSLFAKRVLNTIRVVAGKNRRRSENPKKLYSAICGLTTI